MEDREESEVESPEGFHPSTWLLLVPPAPYNPSMPRISEFFGIIIRMYHREHPPPHFHAKYAEHPASFSIDTLELIEGSLPRRAHAIVIEWAS